MFYVTMTHVCTDPSSESVIQNKITLTRNILLQRCKIENTLFIALFKFLEMIICFWTLQTYDGYVKGLKGQFDQYFFLLHLY
jgi:hypothetical protein